MNRSMRALSTLLGEPDGRDRWTSIGLLILRLGIGGYMLSHGVGKLRMLLAGGAATFPDVIGIGASLSLVLVTFAEFGCALLVMLGLATRLAAVPLVIAMAVAAFVAHGSDPWSSSTAAQAFMSGASKSWASKEPALVYLLAFVALAWTGAGAFSLDRLVWKRPAGA